MQSGHPVATPVGIGLVGAGQHGIRYARHVVRDVEEARLVALCRRGSRPRGELRRRSSDATTWPRWPSW